MTTEEYLVKERISPEVMHSLESELIRYWMREFAKTCVKDAITTIKENINVDIDEYGNVVGFDDIMFESIDNAYPLENIK